MPLNVALLPDQPKSKKKPAKFKARKGFTYQDPDTIDKIIIHDTGMTEHDKPYPKPETGKTWIDSIREVHKKRDFTDIGYHYIIDKEGTVHQSREHYEQGAHAEKGQRNKKSIGISLLGHGSFTDAQKEALKSVVNQIETGYDKKLKIEEHQGGDPNFNWHELFPDYEKGKMSWKEEKPQKPVGGYLSKKAYREGIGKLDLSKLPDQPKKKGLDLSTLPDLPDFDPEGEGYDYKTARESKLAADEEGHWPSRDPRTGLLLKGKKHETWDLLEEGEKDAGYKIVKSDGRYYSIPVPAADLHKAPEPMPKAEKLEKPVVSYPEVAKEFGETPITERLGAMIKQSVGVITPENINKVFGPGFKIAMEGWRRAKEMVAAPLYEMQKKGLADKVQAGPEVAQAFSEAAQGLRITPGREIVKNMGMRLDDADWIEKNPGKQFAGEMLGAWFETYGTDPVMLASWAKSVPYARKAALFNEIVKVTGNKITPATLQSAKIPISPKLAKEISRFMSSGFWRGQAQIAGGLKGITEAQLRQALKAVKSLKITPGMKPPLIGTTAITQATKVAAAAGKVPPVKPVVPPVVVPVTPPKPEVKPEVKPVSPKVEKPVAPTKPLTEEAKKFKNVDEFVNANEDEFSGAVIQTKRDLKEIGFDEGIFNQAVEKGTDAEGLIKLIQSTVGEDKDVGVFTTTFGENVRALVKEKHTLLTIGITKSQLTDIWNQANQPSLEQQAKGMTLEEFVESQLVKQENKEIKETVNRAEQIFSKELLKTYGISDSLEPLAWKRMKDFWKNTEENIRRTYNHFAKEKGLPLADTVLLGDDVNKPLKGLKIRIEDGGELNKDIIQKTKDTLTKMSAFLDKELSVPATEISDEGKAQLTDIWNQAQPKVKAPVKPPTEPPIKPVKLPAGTVERWELETKGAKFFRVSDTVKVKNTQGKEITLPKGEEYRVEYLKENKIKLTDGKQLTIYEGELPKIKGEIIGEGDIRAGGKAHPDSIYNKIIEYGGLNPESVKKLTNWKEAIKEHRVPLAVFSKTGRALDDIANELQADGWLRVPENRNPDEYLLEVLQSKKARMAPITEDKKDYEYVQEFDEWMGEQYKKEFGTEAYEKAEKETVEQRIKALSSLRRLIHAVASKKGLTKKAFTDIKRKYGGSPHLITPGRKKSMSIAELEAVLKAVRRARPKKIGFKTVVSLKTEKKVQDLKTNLTQKMSMTEQDFKDILKKEGLYNERTGKYREPKYIDYQHYITETKARDIIHRMLDEAPIIQEQESIRRAIAKNPEIQKEFDRVQAKIEADQKKRISDPYRTESMRYYVQKMEMKTGAPLWSIYHKMIDLSREMTRSHVRITKQLEKSTPDFKKIAKNEKTLQRVSDYIASKSVLKDRPAMPTDITKDEIKLAQEIEKVFEEYRPKVRMAKFLNYYYYNQPIPDAERYSAEIRKAVDIYEGEGYDALTEYLKTQKWGVIKSGYEPMESIISKVRTYKPTIQAVGKGHVKIRTDINYKKQERNILQRLSSYMRQIDLLSDLQPKIKSFIRLIDDNLEKFDDPKKIAGSIEFFINEIKGYPVNEGFFGELIRRAYSQAMRTIILPSPVLAGRNLLQNLAFTPDYSMLINPANKVLTQADIDYVETYVQQTKSMIEEYFMLNEPGIWGLCRLNKIVDKIKIYPYSDIANRYWGFWAKINQVRAAFNQPVSKMVKEAKLDDFTLLEQKQALAILARDGKDAFARYVARLHTDNIHFLYERSQRSPAEMGTLGRVAGNLALFPRAYLERILIAQHNFTHGKDFTERYRAFKRLLTTIVGGALVGSVYTKVTGRKRNPYNPLNMLAWTPGGLLWGSIDAISDVLGDLVFAVQGDRMALGRLTTSVPRLFDMFIPFYDFALRGFEATKDLKNVDRLVLRKLREQLDKEYKVRGSAYKVNRNAMQKWQYFIGGPGIDKDIKKASTWTPRGRKSRWDKKSSWRGSKSPWD